MSHFSQQNFPTKEGWGWSILSRCTANNEKGAMKLVFSVMSLLSELLSSAHI
jgi:hypothetical protein